MSGQRAAISKGLLGDLRGQLTTGVVTDALSRLGLDGWMDLIFPVKPGVRVVGPAVTVRYAPRRGADRLNKTLYEIIRTFAAGDVLVIEAAGTGTSVFGGNIAQCGNVQGIGAMITDGRCRDHREMVALTMPVFCRGSTVRLPTDLELTAVNVPITCGGAQVNPSDLIVADDDGVVVIPNGQIDAVLYQIDEILGIEAELSKAIRSRAPIAEIDSILKRKKTRRN